MDVTSSSRVDLGLKRVGELPPALDDTAPLAVERARAHQARTERGQRVGELLAHATTTVSFSPTGAKRFRAGIWATSLYPPNLGAA